MLFYYKAQTTDGEVIDGEIEAPTKSQLIEQLRAEGKVVVFVEEITKKEFAFISYLHTLFGKVHIKERVFFARNLGSMIQAGLPLVRSLNILSRQTKNKRFKAIIVTLSQSITKGNSLSVAMSEFKDVFSPLTIAMVKSGEAGGNLSESLNLISNHLDQAYILQSRIRSALMYPGIIMIAMVTIGIIMMIYVVPVLTETFESLGVELPATTKIIIFISEFLKNNILISIILVPVFLVIVLWGMRTSVGKKTIEIALLKMPILGGLVRQINSARTARTLSSLLSSGVDMLEAISITEEVLQNSYYKKVLHEARERVTKGIALSEIFSENEDLYPAFVHEMIAVGEETGKLGEMLEGLALFYEREVEQVTKNLSTIIEPILMTIIGALVGLFAYSMITPLYSVLEGI